MNYRVAFFCLFVLSFHTILAQITPTPVKSEEEDIDTVFIDKDPLVIRETVYVNKKEKKNEVQLSGSYLELYFSALYNYYSYYNVCPSCETYFANLNNSVSPALSYSIGTNYMYMKKHLYLSAGAEYLTIGENFKNQLDGQNYSLTNRYNYANVTATVGYKLQKGRFTIIPEAGLSVGYHLSSSGKTISEADDTTVVDVNSKKRFMDFTYNVVAGIKLLYKATDRIYFSTEPIYTANLRNVISWRENYTEQRNFLGLRIGLVYKLSAQ